MHWIEIALWTRVKNFAPHVNQEMPPAGGATPLCSGSIIAAAVASWWCPTERFLAAARIARRHIHALRKTLHLRIALAGSQKPSTQ